MYEHLDVDEHQGAGPPLWNALTEMPRAFLEMSGLLASVPALSQMPRGDGHSVLVLPGFLASDQSTATLRRYLRFLKYDALPWQLGRNTGRPEIMQRLLVERFHELTDDNVKLTLIGQSLGGVYARELARLYPDKVRQVITLGSPFGTRRGETTLALVRRAFERASGLTIEAMRELLVAMDPHVSPDVPLTAIYSKGDGVVNWRVCREKHEDELTENIEVLGSHCGMGFNPMIYYIIANRLSQPAGIWRRFRAVESATTG